MSCSRYRSFRCLTARLGKALVQRCRVVVVCSNPHHHIRFRASTNNFSTSLSPVPDDNKNVPAIPIDFSTSSVIKGEESNVAFVTLKEGQILRAESGAMVFMTEGVEMDTKLAGASSAFARFLTGQNVFLTDFRYAGGGRDGSGTLALGADFPSKIIRLHLSDHPCSSLICQRGAFMASNPTVDIQTEFTQSLTAGFFGGQGFILQRLTGDGDVLIKAGGTLVKKELQDGEVLRVTSGSIAAFETSCQYNVQMMPGIKNAMFGGEGLFVTTLTGPGLVWLQGMPADRLIAEIARRVPSGSGFGLGVPIIMGGSGSESGGSQPQEDSGTGAVPSSEGESAVAATDSAMEADRNATLASSGIPTDSNSPDALFGDAAPEISRSSTSAADNSDFDSTNSADSSFPPMEDSTTFSTTTNDRSFSSFDENPGGVEDSFGSDFESDAGFSSDGSGPADGELFNDSSDGGLEGGNSDEGNNSLLETLWSFISGGDD